MEPDRIAKLAACEKAFAERRDARGINAVLVGIGGAEAALADLALDYATAEQNDTAIAETRAIVARLINFRDLASQIRKIG